MIPSSAIKAAMFIPRLLKDAKKKSRLMGLSKPRPSRKVDKMKRIPIREKMEVTLSAIIMAFFWLAVTPTAMMGVLLAVSTRALGRVDSGQWQALWRHTSPQTGRQMVSTRWMTEPVLDDFEGDKAIEGDHVNGPQGIHDRREAGEAGEAEKWKKVTNETYVPG